MKQTARDVPNSFKIGFLQCPGCESEEITVSGHYPDIESAFIVDQISCKCDGDIDWNDLTPDEQTKILEYAELRRGDAIACYCSSIEDTEEKTNEI